MIIMLIIIIIIYNNNNNNNNNNNDNNNICLLHVFWSGDAFAFSICEKNFHFLKRTERLVLKVCILIFTILILIMSWPWALFRLRFLIIYRISSFEKSIVDSMKG